MINPFRSLGERPHHPELKLPMTKEEENVALHKTWAHVLCAFVLVGIGALLYGNIHADQTNIRIAEIKERIAQHETDKAMFEQMSKQSEKK